MSDKSDLSQAQLLDTVLDRGGQIRAQLDRLPEAYYQFFLEHWPYYQDAASTPIDTEVGELIEPDTTPEPCPHHYTSAKDLTCTCPVDDLPRG